MDSLIQVLIILTSSLCSFIVFIYYYRFWNGKADKNRVPRAGGALPIIGHLHMFGSKQLVHKTLAAMADKYGPAFTIRLGSQENLVISNWEMAKECFTTHDKVFSDRPTKTATKILAYNFAMFGFAPYGSYWREMRKIVTLQLLSHRRIDMLRHIRASEVQTSLKELYDLWASREDKKNGLLVDMKKWFGDLTLNAAVRMVGGKRFVGASEETETRSQQRVMRDFVYYFGVFVISDAIPLLGWMDIQGHEKTMRRIAKELDNLIGGWLEEHKRKKKISGEGREDQDFMDVMLNVLEDADFPGFDADTINKATCLVIAHFSFWVSNKV
ncbi:hypothetical protein BUALT_Bualt04G0122700 [Buddleja alternifolia]|uniref:Cytochrome P450 n=1 Tax=Buddleja alternifolia TaxID=168488 RepID=A0AAV6XNC2_9LAMI|nr:hypothetical protein BUALT_Bualt04G0122700 [Buddleja alternifolia]